MMRMRRVHAVVHGDVQGVCYRLYTCEQAMRLGVNGWVRNLPDGTVELVAEGTPQAVSGLMDWCRRGPPAATVTAVEVDEADATGEFIGFRISR